MKDGGGNMNTLVELTAPFPPSVNTVYAVYRGRKILSTKGRKYKEEVLKLLGTERASLKGPIKCTYTFYRGDRRRYDISNYVKVIEDCLTECKYWVDDSQVIEIHIFKGDVCKTNPRVDIEIEEING
jgi:crossover junction endodeoxyribonuclease RusA